MIYCFQCLKESYVKALGIGIGFNLQRIDFRTPSRTIDMKPDIMVTDTEVVLCSITTILEQFVYAMGRTLDKISRDFVIHTLCSECDCERHSTGD